MSNDAQTGAGVAQQRYLDPRERGQRLRPFVPATELTDIALYWLPAEYPMRSRERLWLLAFLRQLKARLAADKKLRLETFVQFKLIYPDLMNRFLSRSQEYQPMAGLLLQPQTKPPELPTAAEIEAEVKKGGPVDVKQWMADYCYWFITKQDEQQREDFLGWGGMLLLFLASDPNTKPPELKIPKVMRTHPAFKGSNIESNVAVAYSLQDKFLKQSKEVFGEAVREEPAYPGIPYILPLLAAKDFFRATPTQRTQWFEVFDVYCIESKPDKGMLFAFKDRHSDDTLIDLVQQLRDAGMEYPL